VNAQTPAPPQFQPSTAFNDTMAGADAVSGPDHTASVPLSTEDVVRERIPNINRKNPPRSTESTRAKATDAKPSGLGLNVTRGSGIRKLNKSDAEQIAGMYTFAGMGLFPINQRLGKSIADGADTCADAWVEWANSNDKLRRRILAFLEGGAAMKVFMAHAPIAIAAVPPEFAVRMLQRFGMGGQSEEDAATS
jgi:hypothetical protein